MTPASPLYTSAYEKAARALDDAAFYASPYRNPSPEDKAWKRAMGEAARIVRALDPAREGGLPVSETPGLDVDEEHRLAEGWDL